jgi:hypothetical protein
LIDRTLDRENVAASQADFNGAWLVRGNDSHDLIKVDATGSAIRNCVVPLCHRYLRKQLLDGGILPLRMLPHKNAQFYFEWPEAPLS